MPSDIELHPDIVVLNELINESAIVKLKLKSKFAKQAAKSKPNSATVELVEIDHNCDVISKVIIRGLPVETIVIKADAFPAPSDIFNGNKNENCRTDYIIISHYKAGIVILFIELKSSSHLEKAKKQLKGSHCSLIYMKEIGINFWNKPDFLGSCKMRYIIFREGPIGKNTLKPEITGSEYSNPSTPLCLNYKKDGNNKFDEILPFDYSHLARVNT